MLKIKKKYVARRKYIIIAAYAIAMSSLALWIFLNFAVVINHSDSLPIKGVVIMKNKKPTNRGDIFVFWVKNNSFYKQDVKFIKKLGGGEKDIIQVTTDNRVYVSSVERGTAKKTSLTGLPLNVIAAQAIPKGKFYAYGEHKDSFDSRYQEIGLIDEKDIIGTAIFVF